MSNTSRISHEGLLKIYSVVLIILAVCRIGISIIDFISVDSSVGTPLVGTLSLVILAFSILISLLMLLSGVLGFMHGNGREITAHIKLSKVLVVIFAISLISVVISSFQTGFNPSGVFDPLISFFTVFAYQREAKALQEERSRR